MKTKKHFISMMLFFITSALYAQIATVEHLILENANGATSIGAGDLDNDGDIDFAVTSSDNGDFSWFENNGSMSFTQHILGSGFLGASTVSLRDIDNDNDSDLLACSKNNDKIVLYKNNGYNNFAEQIITDTLNGASYVYMFDMNADGTMDILATACGGNKVMWYENDGSENFTAHVIKDNWNSPTNAFPMDMDFDGDIDVVACGKTGGSILWFENNGSMVFTEDTVVMNWGSPSSVVASDIDEDGDIDIAATSCGSGDAVAWFENNGSFNFTQHLIRDSYSGARSVVVADFDNDDDKDIIAVGWSEAIASIFMNNGSETFSEYIFCNTAYDLLKLVVVDMDLDNDLDIIGSCFGSHELRWWENLSTYIFPDFSVSTYSGHAPLTVNFQDNTNSKPIITQWVWDFNGDNVTDDTTQNPSFTYTSSGSYNVHLWVENDSLQDDTLKTDCIRVFDGESAVEFDGTTGNVVIDSDTAFSPVTNLSIESWIKPYSFGKFGEGRIIDKDYVKIFVYSSGAQANTDSCIVVNIKHADNSVSKFSTPSHSLQLNNWQHIAVTYDGSSSQACIYINGIAQTLDYLVNPNGNIATHATKVLRIGNISNGMRTFDGVIDEIRYWNTTRTSMDISFNMEHYANPASAGLIGYWKMNEGSGDTIFNLANNNHNGIISNSRWQQGKNLLPASINETVMNSVESTFSMHPNPAKEKLDFTITILQDAAISLEIFNSIGQNVLTVINNKTLVKGKHLLAIDVKCLNSGVYYATMSFNNKQKISKKLIIID